MEQQKARFFAPAGQGKVLAGRGDALHHRLDLSLVGRATRIVALGLRDVGHSPPLHRESVLALAPHDRHATPKGRARRRTPMSRAHLHRNRASSAGTGRRQIG
jgi:hypothetical protein